MYSFALRWWACRAISAKLLVPYLNRILDSLHKKEGDIARGLIVMFRSYD